MGSNDKFTIRAVVNYLGLLAVVGLLGIIWLVHDGIAPDRVAVVVALVGPATGALAALLASTRTTDTPTSPVVTTGSTGGAMASSYTAPRAAGSGPIGDAAP